MAIKERAKTFFYYLGGFKKVVIGGNGQDAGAQTQVNISKLITGMADATFVDLFTVTVPNSAQAATIEITLMGSLGAGGAVGAFESSNGAFGLVTVARTAGVATVAVAAALTSSAVASVAGANNAAVAYQVSAITGANGATQTFTIQAKVTKSLGASANHQVLAIAGLLNSQGSGVTIA
jgi:hypothetical protein